MAQGKHAGNNYSRYILVLSIALYAACLSREAFCVDTRCDVDGWGVLIFGGWQIWGSPANFTWVANPILFMSWIAVGRGEKTLSVPLSLIALMLAAAFMLMTTVIVNEGRLRLPITGIKLGYWLWLASAAATCLAALVSKRESRPYW
jgi:hypothetical protein